MQRFFAAAITSVMFGGMVWVAHQLGLIATDAFHVAMVLIALCIVGFYVVIRSGWNESLFDPSLTLPMILASSSVNTFVLYALQGGRGGFLLVYLMSMLFGVFRLSTLQMIMVAVFQIVSYALVIWRLWSDAPASIDVNVEIVQWSVLACVTIWFAFLGGYLSRLINRLGQTEIDELTGAYTRRRIIEIFRHEKLRADRGAAALSICLLDIDRLKAINDRYGHQGGDRQLRRVASAVLRELREVDYLGRYGGDEFLLVLAETPLHGAVECVERMRRTLSALQIEEGARETEVTISVGIAEYQHGESFAQLVARADAALYAAKSAGRDRIECAAPAKPLAS